ncbi:MAG: GAF domain-containing protein, partial [Candidatus Omnitrophica bacterium]|nr:GAF domain-containing protein [Candidatus Omnitrophota bacterium]
MGVVTPFLSSIIIIVYAVLVLFFRKQYFHFRYKSRSKFENLQEKINVLKNDIDGKRVILENLPAKSEKISFLFNISQKLIVLVKEEEIFDFFLSIASDLFADSDGILFFTLQNKSDSLSLTRFKKDKGVVIQEKKGGILDAWILRNNQSLIVDDITKDFRFDYRKVIGFSDRKVHSFIASPFSVGERILGVVRIESKKVGAYTQQDLRLLRSICDLTAVVLERANLFKEIKELAITDPLTSLFLREYLFARLKEEISSAKSKKSGLGIIMIDIDNFK